MRGSVVKKNDRWYVVIEDKDPATGKRIRRWHSGFRTKREAQAACNELAAAMQRGDYLQARKQTVGEFAAEWLVTIAPTVRPSTLDKYRRDLAAHVVPHVGFVQLVKLDGPALNRLWAQLAVSGKKPAKAGGVASGLAAKSVENVAMTVHRMLRDAVRWGRIPKSPAEMADPPKRSATHRPLKAWNADTLRTFLELTVEDELSVLWIVLATTGLRRGEALGLRWCDLDLTAARAHVTQTVIAIGWEIHIGQPKTHAGRRPVALDPLTIAVLEQHHTRTGRAADPARRGVDESYVFADTDGGPLHPERVYQAFKRALRKHQMPAIPLHGLRHTWATIALQHGVHPRVVQERLGHSNIAITLQIYSHVLPTMHDEAAATVAATFMPPLPARQ